MSSNQLILPNWLMLFAVDGAGRFSEMHGEFRLERCGSFACLTDRPRNWNHKTLIVNSWPVTT